MSKSGQKQTEEKMWNKIQHTKPLRCSNSLIEREMDMTLIMMHTCSVMSEKSSNPIWDVSTNSSCITENPKYMQNLKATKKSTHRFSTRARQVLASTMLISWLKVYSSSPNASRPVIEQLTACTYSNTLLTESHCHQLGYNSINRKKHPSFALCWHLFLEAKRPQTSLDLVSGEIPYLVHVQFLYNNCTTFVARIFLLCTRTQFSHEEL